MSEAFQVLSNRLPRIEHAIPYAHVGRPSAAFAPGVESALLCISEQAQIRLGDALQAIY